MASDEWVGFGVRMPGIVEAVAFWTAVVLPVIYLPLLFTGLGAQSQRIIFASLVVLNAVMIVLGHRYGQE